MTTTPTFNKFISDAVAFKKGVINEVSIFAYEGDVVSALDNNGFEQVRATSVVSGMKTTRATNQYFNPKTDECVFLSYAHNTKEFMYTDSKCNPI